MLAAVRRLLRPDQSKPAAPSVKEPTASAAASISAAPPALAWPSDPAARAPAAAAAKRSVDSPATQPAVPARQQPFPPLRKLVVSAAKVRRTAMRNALAALDKQKTQLMADVKGIDAAIAALDELSGGFPSPESTGGGARRKRRRTRRHSPRQ